MDWNLLATIVIITFIVLVVVSKVMHLTILELLAEIKDFFGDKKDVIKENTIEVYE